MQGNDSKPTATDELIEEEERAASPKMQQLQAEIREHNRLEKAAKAKKRAQRKRSKQSRQINRSR